MYAIIAKTLNQILKYESQGVTNMENEEQFDLQKDTDMPPIQPTTLVVQPQQWSIEELKKQMKLIQEVHANVMKKDEHYGRIPGTSKDTLYKAGAEKLNLVFRMAPKYKIEIMDSENGHKTYNIICELYHINTGNFLGQGVGACSTLESNFRYRNTAKDTGNPVPKKFWDLKKEDYKKAQVLIGGNGFQTKKNDDGPWTIWAKGEKKETLKALKSASGFIAIQSSKEITIRYFPKLSFILDEGVDKQMHIEKILADIESQKSEKNDHAS